MEKEYIVYMHVSPSDKRYIGVTCLKTQERWRNNGLGYKSQPYFYRAIEKYGWDNFQHIIVARGLDEETAKWLEMELIREWDTTNPNKGYNLTKGGDGVNGLSPSKETREKISKTMKGKKCGKDNPMYGKGYLVPWYGKTLSEEHRRKCSENSKGKNGKKVIIEETGEIFDTIKECAKRLGYKCSSVIVAFLKGKRKGIYDNTVTPKRKVTVKYLDEVNK